MTDKEQSSRLVRDRLCEYSDGSPTDLRLLELIEKFCEAFCQYEINSPQWKSNSLHWQKAFIPLMQAISELKLARPRHHHEEYAGILHETFMQVRNLMCTEFAPCQGASIPLWQIYLFTWAIESGAYSLMRYVSSKVGCSRQGSLQKSLTVWINKSLRLRYKIIELFQSSRTVSIDIPNDTGDTYADLLPNEAALYVPRLDGIENLIADELQNICQRLRNYIETDPEGKLIKCHPPKYPQWNCQEFAIRRYLRQPPQAWKAIENEFGIPLGTLNPEAQRRFLPLLKEIARDLGYE